MNAISTEQLALLREIALARRAMDLAMLQGETDGIRWCGMELSRLYAELAVLGKRENTEN